MKWLGQEKNGMGIFLDFGLNRKYTGIDQQQSIPLCSKLCSLNNVDNHLKLFFGFRLILGIRFTQILTTKDTFIQFLWEAESQSNDD